MQYKKLVDALFQDKIKFGIEDNGKLVGEVYLLDRALLPTEMGGRKNEGAGDRPRNELRWMGDYD